MKKIILSLLLCTAIASSAPVSAESATSYDQLVQSDFATLPEQKQIKVLSQLCTLYNQLFSTAIISLMHEIETSISYWHTMEDKPFSYAIIRGPKGWISSQTAHNDMQDHIRVLERTQHQLAHILGTLTTLQKANAVSNVSELRQLAADHITLSTQLVENNSFPYHDNLELAGIADHLLAALKVLPSIGPKLLVQLKPHLKPGHFVRNWVRYAIGITAATAASVALYQHPDAVAPLGQKTLTGIRHLWSKHVKIPFQNTRDILFGHKHYNVITPEAIEGDKKVLRKSLTAYLPKVMPLDTTQEHIQEHIEYVIRTKDSSVIKEDWDKQVNHWFANFCWDKIPYFGEGQRLGESTSLIMQVKDLQLSEATMAGQEAWEAQQLNAELFAVFPVLLGLYGIKKGYDKLFHAKIICEPIQKRLRVVDQLLNHHNHGVKKLDTVGTGFLHYHVHALMQHVRSVEAKDQKDFKNDIMQLGNPALHVEQKLRVIDQMYRHYKFLLPTML